MSQVPELEIREFVQGSRKCDVSAIVYVDGCNLQCTYCDPAVHVASSHISVAKVLRSLKTNRADCDTVLITGGEPLKQYDALLRFIRAIRKVGITTVELVTNGTYPMQLIDILRKKYVNRVTVGIKSPYQLKQFIGACNKHALFTLAIESDATPFEFETILCTEYVNDVSVIRGMVEAMELEFKIFQVTQTDDDAPSEEDTVICDWYFTPYYPVKEIHIAACKSADPVQHLDTDGMPNTVTPFTAEQLTELNAFVAEHNASPNISIKLHVPN